MVLPTDLIGIMLGLSHTHIMRLRKEFGWLTLIRLSWIASMMCAWVVMRECSCTDIRVSGIWIGGIVDRRTATGHAALWCMATRHWVVGCRLYIPCF